MAQSDPIKRSDLVEEGAIREITKDFEDLGAYLPTIESSITSLAKKFQEISKGISFTGLDVAGLKKFNDLMKETNDLYMVDEKVRKLQAQAAAAESKQRQEEVKERKLVIQEQQREQKEKEKSHQLSDQEIAQKKILQEEQRYRVAQLKAEILEVDKNIISIRKLNAENANLRAQVANVNIATKAGQDAADKYNRQIDSNTKIINRFSDTLVRNKMNIGNYANSIRDAFAGTGILGETIGKYLTVITVWSEKIEAAVSSLTKEKEASEAAAEAAKANATAKEAEAAATAEATTAEKGNVAALESEVAATEEAEAANKGLLSSLKALATNPYVILIAGLVALTKVVYDNATAIQSNKDEVDAWIESGKEFVKNLTLGPVAAAAFADFIHDLTIETDKLTDAQISAIRNIAALRAEGQKAREESTEEGKTTRKRIDLLGKFIEKNNEAFDIEIEHAKKLADLKMSYFVMEQVILGKEDREARRVAEEAAAHVEELERQKNREVVRAQRQRTTLTQKYNDDILKMQQEQQKQEVEMLDSFSQYKAEAVKKQLSKDLKLNQIETKQAVQNRKKEQDELGAIDAEGISHQQEFDSELQTIKNLGAAKAKQLRAKANAELAQLQMDFQEKSIDAERKFREDLRKLQEAYDKTKKENIAIESERNLQGTQYQIDNEKSKVKELIEQRNYEISVGKEKYKLTENDLRQYLDLVDKLEEQHYNKEQERLVANAAVARQNEQKQKQDAIDAIKDKYAKQKEEQDKAILNAAKTPEEAKKDIENHDKDRAQNQAKEIEGVEKGSAEVIVGIDAKMNSDLDKSDQDHTKRTKDNAKERTDTRREEHENFKRLVEEEKTVVNQVTEGIAEGLRRQSELREQGLQNEIDFHNREIEVQSRLAAEGKDNVLAEELSAAQVAEEKKLQEQKRQAKIQQTAAEVKTFSDVFFKALEKGEPFLKAVGEGAAATEVVKEVFARLFAGTAFTGIEDTGAGGNLDNKGGMAWILHPNERILSKKQNDKLKGMSNEDLVNNALMFANTYAIQYKATTVLSEKAREIIHYPALDPEMVNVFKNGFKELKQSIDSKPSGTLQLKGLGRWAHESEENGIKRIRHYDTQKRLPSLRLNG